MSSDQMRKLMENLEHKTLTESEIADSLGYVVVVVQDVHKTWKAPKHVQDGRRTHDVPEEWRIPYSGGDYWDYNNMITRELSVDEGMYLAKNEIKAYFTPDISKAKWFRKPEDAVESANEANQYWNKRLEKANVKSKDDPDIEICAGMKAFIMLERLR